MKMNKIYKAIAALSILSALSISCSDDFIDRSPAYSIDSENYFNSKEDYDNALIAAYDMLQSTYVNVMLGEIASDNTLTGSESATDTPGFHQIDAMTHTPVNSNLKNIWDWMYAGVNRANYILEFKDKTAFEGKEALLAQAYFLRAYYQFELVKWFGAIPVNGDKRFKIGDETVVPRTPANEVYVLIESDLQYAIDHLSTGVQAKGRITVGAARALLGKVYLYDKKYAEAATVLETVINSGTYSLVTDYSTIFENNNENNSESVFEVQYSDDEGAGFPCLQCSEGNVAVGFNGPRNYTGPLFESGYSFNVPTAEAYNSYEIGDKRRDIAILDIVAWAAQTGATYGKGYEHTGYYNRKYIPRVGDQNLGDDKLTNPNNYRSIRYADVLLMAAEAFNRTGDDTKAQLYLNMVRRRAFGDNNHDKTSQGPALLEFILAERRAELMGEGHRFFDLVRTGKAEGTIQGFTAGKNEVFPIPQEEIQFSNGNWQQNPGY